MNNYLIIMNEQHQILPTQKQQIEKNFGQIKEENIIRVPASGWTLDEMKQIVKKWTKKYPQVIFISPIPYMIRAYTEKVVKHTTDNSKKVWLFHNDKREKTETPDGKVFYRLSSEGWQLV